MHGFTLIEIIAIVAIIGILFAITQASKEPVFEKNNDAIAKAFLLEISNRQASYWQRHGHYAETLSMLKVITPKTVIKHYKIALEASLSPPHYSAYIVKAIPLVKQGDAKILWLNHLGATSVNWSH